MKPEIPTFLCRRAWAVVLAALLIATLAGALPAGAFETVVCFADSIGATPDATTNYCARLQALRPDLAVVNRSAGGRNTVQALAQVSDVVDAACGDSECLVLLHHGVNDMLLEEFDVRSTSRRLRSIWSRASRCRREGWILTPLPFRSPLPEQNEFTREVGNQVIALARRRIPVFDARDLFSIVGWDDHTSDGVHPNEAGALRIAQALAAEIPEAP
jgi:lysophospholipase L1-like esterase